MNNLFSPASKQQQNRAGEGREQRGAESRAESRHLHDYLTFFPTWLHSTSSYDCPGCSLCCSHFKPVYHLRLPPLCHPLFPPPCVQCPATFKQFRLLKAYAAHFTLNHTNKCHFIQQIFAASSGSSGKNIAPHTSQHTHTYTRRETGTHAHTYAKSHTSFCHQFSKQQTNRRATHAHTHRDCRSHTHTLTHTYSYWHTR